MSAEAMVWAKQTKTGSVSRKAVLLVLADCHNAHTGKCCPRISRVADETDLSERSVQYALSGLEQAGHIRRIRTTRADGGQGVNNLMLMMPTPVQDLHPPPDTLAPPPGANLAPLELEVDLEPLTEADASVAPRKRDAVWDSLEALFGEAPKAKTHRGSWNRACADLKIEGSDGSDLAFIARKYHKTFEGAALTPTALAKHYVYLRNGHKVPDPPCAVCGTGGGRHAMDCPEADF